MNTSGLNCASLRPTSGGVGKLKARVNFRVSQDSRIGQMSDSVSQNTRKRKHSRAGVAPSSNQSVTGPAEHNEQAASSSKPPSPKEATTSSPKVQEEAANSSPNTRQTISTEEAIATVNRCHEEIRHARAGQKKS